jgi:hypothetical protein
MRERQSSPALQAFKAASVVTCLAPGAIAPLESGEQDALEFASLASLDRSPRPCLVGPEAYVGGITIEEKRAIVAKARAGRRPQKLSAPRSP